jgi:signal transduction histidine kinase
LSLVRLRERVFSGVTIVLMGLAVLGIPLAIVQATAAGTTPGEGIVTVETVILVALATLIVGAGVWLHHQPWERSYETTVATWTLIGAALTAAVFGWLLVVQLVWGGQPRPAVIVADAVLLGTIGAFVAGVYRARDAIRRDTLSEERDRFSALFESTTDCIVGVELTAGAPTIRAVNEAFASTFDGGSVSGQPLSTAVPDYDGRIESMTADLEAGRRSETEIRRQTATGSRDFLVQTVPIGGTQRLDGYVIFTDITAQKRRERQLGWLNQASRGMTLAEGVEEIAEIVAEVAAHSFERASSAVYHRRSGGQSLEPVASDASGDDAPSLTVAELGPITPSTVEMRALESGQRTVIEDYHDAGDRSAPEAPFSTALLRPIDDDTLLVLWIPAHSDVDTLTHSQLGTLTRSAGVALQALQNRNDLERRNAQLELLNSLLRHEIQNAITVIRSRAEHLVETGPESQANIAATIYERSDDVATLVDRFRLLLDAFGEEGPAETVDVAAIARERVDALRAVHPEVHVDIDAPETCHAIGDEALPVVLDNLLHNAVDHNDGESPTVSVSVQAGDESVTICVVDDGPGIPDEFKPSIFQRGDTATNSASDSGFGLFFVETMIERYGGSIAVTDAATGGAKFELTLPTSAE